MGKSEDRAVEASEEFKTLLQRMIDSRIGPGKPFPSADDVAKVAHVSKRNFTNFKVKVGQEPNRGVLTKMATSLGFPAEYFTYMWDFFSGASELHPDDKYPDYALGDELALLAGDNEHLFDRLLLLVESNPDYFGYSFGDLHLERAIQKLEQLIDAESQTNFI